MLYPLKPMNAQIGSISYSIDPADEIVAVGDDWDRFAIDNGAPRELLSDRIMHRSFWEFVSGETVEHVYRVLLAKVRGGASLAFNFRCDSPALRRFLTLRMYPVGTGGIEFITETVRTEEREFEALFDTTGRKADGLILACSWCNKVKTAPLVWLEAEEAVRVLGLFENNARPSLSHGMCGACYLAVTEKRKLPRRLSKTRLSKTK